VQSKPSRHGRRLWKWLGISALLSALVLAVVATLVLRHAGPILKGRVVETLSERFHSNVALDTLEVSFLHGIEVTGSGLRIAPPDDVVAAGDKFPLIAVRSFSFHAPLRELFIKPTHVTRVRVSGLVIHVPPNQQRAQSQTRRKHFKEKTRVDEIECDDSTVFIDTVKAGKDPRIFLLQHVELHNLGRDRPWPYDATLINPLPRGLIHASGSFGPWSTESPGESHVDGHYTFDHADLNTIHGLGGLLSSTGAFDGQLNRIVVDGITDTPNFSLDSANHAVPLHTQFHAIVDGISGDTYLQPVIARLGRSDFTCTGAVVYTAGQGHTIDVQADIPAGQIRDFLSLAVRTQPPLVEGMVSTRTTLHIVSGSQSVTHRLSLRGSFQLTRLHFTRPKVQDQIDFLSQRAQGHPEQAHAGAPDVPSRMNGALVLHNGRIDFSRIDYALPGATVNLSGVYTLDGRTFNFHGKVRTQARLSQMVASRWKSWLLKGVDPFFHKNGAGAEIPVKITGTESAPKFGLDFGHSSRR
jgi:hypothetical protein